MPASCGIPSSIGVTGPTGPTASKGASHFANLVARNVQFMTHVGVPSGQLSRSFNVTTESPTQVFRGIDPALRGAASPMVAYATAFDGPNSQSVVGTEVEQFPSQKAALIYDKAIFSYDCLSGREMFSTPNVVGAFGAMCACTNGHQYFEVSMVIGDYRVALQDWSPTQSPAQATNWASLVAHVATLDYPGM